jgi:hypothetical protein
MPVVRTNAMTFDSAILLLMDAHEIPFDVALARCAELGRSVPRLHALPCSNSENSARLGDRPGLRGS